MGSVWLAERADGLFARRVALKLVHSSLFGSALAQRFERERSILGALDHPHIARLLDAGVADDGQPYLALEYVDGVPLGAFCDGARLTLQGRVRLIIQALDAVRHAHQNLVVHRDLKPSNILVTRDGQAHLLDFGIAKLMIDGQAQETELTQLGGRALTPDYASPEQIAGRPVSTASDVYSLGVVLYEQLCGQRPYRLERDSRGALEQAILDADPAKPSQQGGDAATADARATTPRKLASALAGDLDTIVAKALKKAPAERYATADAFRQDLQRWLDGEAVLARPDSFLYRAGKFVRRHRAGVAVTLLVLLSLGAGLAGTAWQSQQAKQQSARALAVQEFLVGLFNEADPARAQGRELTAREMVDRGQRDVQVKLASQPELGALLDGVLVDLYIKLGDENRALPLAEARRDLALRAGGERSLDFGDALYSLAIVHGRLNHDEIAYQLYAQARSVLQRYPRERSGELLMLDGHVGEILSLLGRPKEAVEVFESLLPKIASHFGASSWELVDAKSALVAAYADTHDYAKAAPLIAELEPAMDQATAARAINAAELRVQLGYAQFRFRKYAASVALLTRAIADADRLLGPTNSLSILAQRTLGLSYAGLGRYDLEAQTFSDSVERAVRLNGEDHVLTRYAESFGVEPLIMTGQTATARVMAERSVRNADKVAGLAPASARGFERRLGLALVFDGEVERGAQALERVLELEAKAGTKHGAFHGTTLLYLAGARAAQGRHEAAAQAARQATESFDGIPGTGAATAHTRLTEALARARLGQIDAAKTLIEQAGASLHQDPEPKETDLLFMQLAQAEALRAEGSAAEGERIDTAARARFKSIGGISLPQPLPLVF